MKNNTLSNSIRLAVVLTLIICTLTPATRAFAQSQPEISVLSDTYWEVLDGDITPDTSDGTDFGDAPTNGAHYNFSSFSICNEGVDDLHLTGASPVQLTGDASFSITQGPDITTISPYYDCTTIEIRFAPTTTGTKNAIINIANDDSNENPYNFNITGNGVDPAPAEIDVESTNQGYSIPDGNTSLSTSNHTDFGDTPTDSPRSFTYNICNEGDLDLTLSGLPPVALTGDASFSITTQAPGSIIAGRECDSFQITFTPTTTGTKTATVSIANDDADENPYTFDIAGNGVDPAPEMDITDYENGQSIADGDTATSVGNSTDFGDIETSASQSLSYYICNYGETSLNLTGTPLVQLTGDADFSVTQDPQSSVSVYDCTTFQIEFTPTTTGAKTATVSIANNDADENPYTFAIAGNGIVPTPAEIYIYGNTHQVTIDSGDTTPSLDDDTDLGTLEFGADSMDYAICNSGGTALHLTGTPLVQLTGDADFSVTVDPSNVIAARDCTTFSIMLDPTSNGTKTTEISIANDDTDDDENPYTFVIQGKTLAPDQYENDDTSASAKPISAGIPQIHSIAPTGDIDYMTFTLNGEAGVTLETSGSDPDADTILDLYKSNNSLIAHNDDNGTSFYSRITRTCNINALPAGTYYVSVRQYNDSQTIPDYTISLTKTACPKTLTLNSIAAQDGSVLESSEKSNTGGSLNSTTRSFFVGDNASKKQYVGILSFNTSGIPDNATITSVKLKIKKSGIVGGGNPVTAFQGFMADIKNGSFGTAALQIADFQTPGTASYGPFIVAPVNNLYTLNLTPGKLKINKLNANGGLTQIRLRFKLDDNNNAVANYLALFSGNAIVATDQPQLVITYIIQ